MGILSSLILSAGIASAKGEQQTFAFRYLDQTHAYLILINTNEEVMNLASRFGLSGKYGHLVWLYKDTVYTCWPASCRTQTICDLEQAFAGQDFEIRDVSLDGNLEKAKEYFETKLSGQPYDVFTHNSTDMFVEMLTNGERYLSSVHPVSLDTGSTQAFVLKREMRREDRNLERRIIYFPEQFRNFGLFAGSGKFEP